MEMNKLFLILLITLVLNFSFSSSEEFGYNLLEEPRIINETNIFQNITSSGNWSTNSLGILDDANSTQFESVVETLTIKESWLTSFGNNIWCALTGCTMQGSIDMDGNDITNVNFLSVQKDTPDPLSPMVNISNQNTDGTTFVRLENDVGAQIAVGIFGLNASNNLFSSAIGANTSALGISSRGAPLTFATRDNDSILFGGSPNDNLTDATYSVIIDPRLNALILQENKFFVPIRINGGFGLATFANESLTAGGVPFADIARDSEGDLVVTSAQQNGKNNSFSFGMNTQGAVPKSWIVSNINDSESIEDFTAAGNKSAEFIFNITNYVEYCAWLQDNNSLVPEGCKYFADTTGRILPLTFTGDLEVHRTATIHEGTTLFNAFDFIGRSGNDANFLFNGGPENGNVHIRDKRNILANVTDVIVNICDFDDGTLCDFVSESIAPEPGRDWSSVLELQCHDDRCANSKGGDEKIMCYSAPTLGVVNLSVSFWLTSVLSGGDTMTVTLDDNQGNSSTEFTTSTTVIDQQYSITFPTVYENKSNVSTCFILNGQNANRQVWVDEIIGNGTYDPIAEINESYDGGRIVLGEDMGVLSCGIETFKQINNNTLDTEWVTQIGCPSGVTEILGNATFVNTQVENQTVIGDSLITGDLTVDGNITTSYFIGNGDFLTGSNLGQWNSTGSNLYPDSLDWNVGIGTSSPSVILDIEGAGQQQLDLTDTVNGVTTSLISGTSNGFVGTTTESNLRLMTNSNTKMAIVDSTGYVGINDSSPEALFHITSTENGLSPSNSNTKMAIEHNGTAYLEFVGTAGDTGGLWFSQDGVLGSYIINTDGTGLRFASGGDEVGRMWESGGFVWGDDIVTTDPGVDNMDVEGSIGATAFCPDGLSNCAVTTAEAFTGSGIGTSNIYAGSGGEVDFQDNVNFNAKSVKSLTNVASHFYPATDNTYDLGQAQGILEWRNAFFDGTVRTDTLTVDASATIASVLTVGGRGEFRGGIQVESSTAGLCVDDDTTCPTVSQGDVGIQDGGLCVGTGDCVIPADGSGLFESDLTVTDDLFVNDFARADALGVGAAVTDPGNNNLYVAGTITSGGIITAGTLNGFVSGTGLCGDASGPTDIGRCGSLLEYKKEIRNLTLDDALALAYMDLNPVIYKWKAPEEQDPNYTNAENDSFSEYDGQVDYVGFIAEEVANVSTLLGKYDENGELYGYQENGILAVNTAMIQHQQEKIAELKNNITNLESEVQYLEDFNGLLATELISMREEMCVVYPSFTWC